MSPLKQLVFFSVYLTVNTGASSTAEITLIKAFSGLLWPIFLSSLDCVVFVRGLFA